jgi:hypothetical protein
MLTSHLVNQAHKFGSLHNGFVSALKFGQHSPAPLVLTFAAAGEFRQLALQRLIALRRARIRHDVRARQGDPSLSCEC